MKNMKFVKVDVHVNVLKMCCMGKIHHMHTWTSMNSFQITKAYKRHGYMYAKLIDNTKYFILWWGRSEAWQK